MNKKEIEEIIKSLQSKNIDKSNECYLLIAKIDDGTVGVCGAGNNTELAKAVACWMGGDPDCAAAVKGAMFMYDQLFKFNGAHVMAELKAREVREYLYRLFGPETAKEDKIYE